MLASTDIDPHDADSRQAQSASLAGPLKAGFQVASFALDDAGKVTLGGAPLRSSLFLRLLRPVSEDTALKVETSGGAAQELTFEAGSDAGTSLFVGPLPANSGASLTVSGAPTLKNLVAIEQVSGNFGLLISLLSLEHQRVRKHVHDIALSRTVAGASAAQLDRIGSEIGVRRFDSRLVFNANSIALSGDHETDESYRGRLSTFRGWQFATHEDVLSQLKEIHPQFGLDERESPYENAVRLVAVGATQADADDRLANGFKSLRANWLIDPAAAPPHRPVSNAEQQADAILHAQLKQNFASLPASAPLAPALARMLNDLLLLKKAGNVGGAVGLLQGQTDKDGAAYELGLGARLSVPADFAIKLAEAVVAAPAQQLGQFAPLGQVFKSMLAVPGARPSLASIMQSFGFNTIRQISATEIYLSHLPVGTIDFTGPATLLAGDTGTYVFADLLNAGDELMQAVSEAATLTGISGATRDAAAIAPMLGTLPDHDANAPAQLFDGRFTLANQKSFAAALSSTLQGADASTMRGLEVQGDAAKALRAGQSAAWDQVGDFAFALADRGVVSLAVLMRENGNVVLAASMAALPLIGPNLTQRQSVSLRWWATRLDESDQTGQVQFQAGGSRREFRFEHAAPGLWCVNLIAYRRRGLPDPMEVRPTLPEGVIIDYADYERMMNVLDAACPVAVEINTWRIRQRHVRLDASLPQAPLNVSASRSFRRFRDVRFAGSTGQK